MDFLYPLRVLAGTRLSPIGMRRAIKGYTVEKFLVLLKPIIESKAMKLSENT